MLNAERGRSLPLRSWASERSMHGIDIKEELAAVDETKRAALDAARPEAVAKQHALGKLTARERLDLLVDLGTFLE